MQTVRFPAAQLACAEDAEALAAHLIGEHDGRTLPSDLRTKFRAFAGRRMTGREEMMVRAAGAKIEAS